MIYLGSHVGMGGKEMFLGSVKEALSYGANTFMVYTGAPQNTRRKDVDQLRIDEAHALMKEAGITAVYYQELVEPYIADTIAEAAGGETYLFHSCHNVSRDDFESGVTYLSLMEQNALNLEKGLNR